MRSAFAAAMIMSLLACQQAHAAGQVITVQVMSSTTTTTPPVIPGGGGSSGSASSPTAVTVSGRAYPLSRVFVLRDGARAADTIAGPDGRFSVTLTRLGSGQRTISVYGEDDGGRRSVLFSFPLQVTAGATTVVSGIFISPTIDANKSAVRRGDPIVFFGKTAPQSSVTIEINSETQLFEYAQSDADGGYLYQLDSSRLEMGQHSAQSRAATGTEISTESSELGFVVGTENVLKGPASDTCQDRRADLNCDARVNLVDYSILAYWYGRPGPYPSGVDLSGDGAVSLVDMSIMAYYWTG